MRAAGRIAIVAPEPDERGLAVQGDGLAVALAPDLFRDPARIDRVLDILERLAREPDDDTGG